MSLDLNMTFLSNPRFNPHYLPRGAGLDQQAGASVAELVTAIFGHRPTPLVSLETLAKQTGVASVHIKDEGARLGLKSFKALGGAYAVVRMVCAAAAQSLQRPIAIDELPRPLSGSLDSRAEDGPGLHGSLDFRNTASRMTFACATDGNHGQSVAAGARLVGAKAVIFVHEGVSEHRRQAIARFGAELVVVAGSYDDAVQASIQQAQAKGWTLLSDTSWPGYTEAPKLVMEGYTLMAHELSSQLPRPPTHVFLQAGVGGFAAALAASLFSTYDMARPKIVVVEPSRAACLLASARAGRSVKIDVSAPTLMSMLECYEPSLSAWELLSPMTTAFMTVEEDDAITAMKALAYPGVAAETVVAGESGAAGLAGFLRACRDPRTRAALGLDASSRVLLINTEGATDEDRYTAFVGATPSAIVSSKTAHPQSFTSNEKAQQS